MSLIDKKVTIDFEACSTCAQYIATCPEKALSWDGILPVDFDPASLPSPHELEELLMQRRTVRTFRDEPVDRQTLEEIISWGGCAPTHNFHLRCIAIDDPEIVEAFDKAAFHSRKEYTSWCFALG